MRTSSIRDEWRITVKDTSKKLISMIYDQGFLIRSGCYEILFIAECGLASLMFISN